MNAVIGRITGKNPSPVTESAAGAEPAQSSEVGAPPSPIMQNFQQPPAYGGGDLQQMQQRMQMLEQKVSMYEAGDTEAADKKVRRAKEAQSNRAGAGDSSGGTYAPNMNTSAAAKKIMAKDVADGQTDPPKKQPQGQPMAAHKNILGISMNEWNDLIGVTTPYANPSEAQNNLSEARSGEEFEEFTEGYFTEDELAEAWFGFISDKGYDPDEFADFAEAAEEYGDEAAILAIQDLEDEFQEQVDACIEVDEARLSQEEIEAFWDIWLEDRGLSTELFHFMIDEAIATEDQDEMDNLLAVEDLFYEQLNQLDEQSTYSVKKMLRGKAGQQVDPTSLGAKPSASFLARTRKQGAEQKKDDPKPKPGQGVMVGRNLRTAANEASETLPARHPRAGAGATRRMSVAIPTRKGAAKPLPRKGAPAKELSNKEKMAKLSKMTMRLGTEATEATPDMAAVLSRRRAAGSEQLPAHLRQKVQKKAGSVDPSYKPESRRGFPAWHMMRESEESINFECDSDAGGGPAIDWERLTKSYEKKQRKGKR
jgi:hypothetical protein